MRDLDLAAVVADAQRSLETWLPTALAIGLAYGSALFVTAILHELGTRRLDQQRGAHWSELARQYAETNQLVHHVQQVLVFGTMLLAIPPVREGGSAGATLRCYVLTWAVMWSVSHPVGCHWVKRATAGHIEPTSFLSALRASLMSETSAWVAIGFAAMAPDRYDAYGIGWGVAFAVALLAAGAGGAIWLGRARGWLTPVDEAISVAISKQTTTLPQPIRGVYAMHSSLVFVSVTMFPRWVLVSHRAIELLTPHELASLVSYQLKWLRMPLRSKLWMLISRTALRFAYYAFIPAFPTSPRAGVLLGVMFQMYFGHAFAAVGRQAPRARKRASVGESPARRVGSRYPLALERQYEANWQPVVLPDGQGNSLYELLTRAGVPPRYPRPQPVSTRRLQLATALALAVALAIGVSLHQLLWPRARWF